MSIFSLNVGAPAQANASDKMGVDAEPGQAKGGGVWQGGGERRGGAAGTCMIWILIWQLGTGARHSVQRPDATLPILDPLSLVEIVCPEGRSLGEHSQLLQGRIEHGHGLLPLLGHLFTPSPSKQSLSEI